MPEERPKGNQQTGDPGVLSSLPSTRPARLSRHARDGASAAKPAAKAKPKPAAKRKPKAKAKARPKPATPEPTPIAAAAEKPHQRPAAVRAGHPTLGKPPATRPSEGEGQSGLDLVKTVVQAAGEVAQLGVTVGGQVLKRVVDKLPRKP